MKAKGFTLIGSIPAISTDTEWKTPSRPPPLTPLSQQLNESPREENVSPNYWDSQILFFPTGRGVVYMYVRMDQILETVASHGVCSECVETLQKWQ